MKLNNKGYLIVEIIVASVIAMTMMYFLMEITIKIKDINEDYYVQTKLETDKVLMTREIMNDINSMEVTNIEKDTETNAVKLSFDTGDIKMIKFTSENDKIIFEYGKATPEGYNFDGDIYRKSFDQKLAMANDNISVDKQNSSDTNSSDYINIDVVGTNIYSNVDYGIKLVMSYNKGEVTIKKNGNYFYYTSHGYTSDDRSDEIPIVYIYACDSSKCDDSGNCDCKKTSVDSNFLFYSPGQYAAFTLTPDVVANNSNLYFTKFVSTYNSSSMSIFKCNLDGTECNSIINNITIPSGITELSSTLLVNDKYLYYTNYYDYDRNSSTKYMQINRCNLDGTNCTKVGANPQRGAAVKITGTRYPIYVENGGSVKAKFAINDNHLYYTSYYGTYDSSYYMTIYVCDIDGTNCKALNNNTKTAKLTIGESYNHYTPEITASNEYFYYTSYNGNSKTKQMAIYRCNTDGTNCTLLKDAQVASAESYGDDSFGGAFIPQVSATDNNFYYTNNYYEYRNGFFNDLYVCNADGTNCSLVKQNKGCYSGGYSSIFTKIASNSDNMYFTSCYQDYDVSPYMMVYKCDANGSNCKNIADADAIVEFRSCGRSGTSTYCNNMAFGNQNPLISAIR